MREIKFKAWDKKTQEMYTVIEMGWRDEFGVRIGFLENPDWGSRIRTLDEIELMQFTGLHDKNGKEIYEGDIVKVNDYLEGTVVWHSIAWMIEIFTWEHFTLKEGVEVIGNIYETPNLRP